MCSFVDIGREPEGEANARPLTKKWIAGNPMQVCAVPVAPCRGCARDCWSSHQRR
jgi:hypothetical protein